MSKVLKQEFQEEFRWEFDSMIWLSKELIQEFQEEFQWEFD